MRGGPDRKARIVGKIEAQPVGERIAEAVAENRDREDGRGRALDGLTAPGPDAQGQQDAAKPGGRQPPCLASTDQAPHRPRRAAGHRDATGHCPLSGPQPAMRSLSSDTPSA